MAIFLFQVLLYITEAVLLLISIFYCVTGIMGILFGISIHMGNFTT